MAIPLVASAAPVLGISAAADLLNANDSIRAATVAGNWVAVGGTLTVDTTSTWQYDAAPSSLKWVTNAFGNYLQLSVAGTFLAGVEYVANVAFVTEEDIDKTHHHPLEVLFGVPGTDRVGESTNSYYDSASGASSYGNYFLLSLTWVPTADRSGVKLRLTNEDASATTWSWHVGLARVQRSIAPGSVALVGHRAGASGLRAGLSVYGGTNGVWLGPSALGSYSNGLYFGNEGTSGLEVISGLSGLYVPNDNTDFYVYAEHDPGEMARGATTGDFSGFSFDVGSDYVGVVAFERDSTALGIRSTYGNTMELQDYYGRFGGDGLWYSRSPFGSRMVALGRMRESPVSDQGDLMIGAAPEAYTAKMTDISPGGMWTFETATSEALLWPSFAARVETEGAPVGTQTVNYEFWVSIYNQSTPGGSKTLTLRLRRTDLSGAILASDVYTTTTDSQTGHLHHWTGTYSDVSPTDGVYVLTVQSTHNAILGWSDTHTLDVSGNRKGGTTERLAKGNDYEVLTVDPIAGPFWKPARGPFQFAFHVTGVQTTGTAKNEPQEYIQLPFGALIDEVRAHVGTAPTGATFIVDVNINGTTVFTTQANRPTIAISGTNATSGAPDTTTFVKNDRLSIDVDQVGSTIAGSDLTVMVRGRYV